MLSVKTCQQAYLAAPGATGTLTSSASTSLQNLQSWFLNVVAKGAMAAQGGYGQCRSTNQHPWSHQDKPFNRHVLCDLDRMAEYATFLWPALSALIILRTGAHTLVESDRWLTPKPLQPAGVVHNKQVKLSNTCWLTALVTAS